MSDNTESSLARGRQRSSHGRQQDEGVLLIRTIAMPADTNPSGDIFGGWLMSQMDLAAGNMASRVSLGRCATVSVDTMQFLRPVKVGDEVTLYATLQRVGRTSLSIHIDVWARPRYSEKSEKVTDADFVFVALDDNGVPRPVFDES
ncbi:acyl-CoA thioesterase [Cohaesibacter celericrescens]|uniref:Acyl-CoA thioesterase n=2 Tax=Cohaesibacter celericrescens TaxID=2067669 RepID=A0A2N5XQQ8_9HYPH|nr:acyl-CoA thioesterase [Cohaesibacter celericrescens]